MGGVGFRCTYAVVSFAFGRAELERYLLETSTAHKQTHRGRRHKGESLLALRLCHQDKVTYWIRFRINLMIRATATFCVL